MLRYFLGIEVMRSKHGIFLSQMKYVLDVLSETRKLGHVWYAGLILYSDWD